MADLILDAAGIHATNEIGLERLAAARRRLESASSPVRVSTVALDCGFQHFGRFAASYRAAFGESPAETVRSGEPSLREQDDRVTIA
jgi:transcriptional regulator GlxA family with amidase domain